MKDFYLYVVFLHRCVGAQSEYFFPRSHSPFKRVILLLNQAASGDCQINAVA